MRSSLTLLHIENSFTVAVSSSFSTIAPIPIAILGERVAWVFKSYVPLSRNANSDPSSLVLNFET